MKLLRLSLPETLMDTTSGSNLKPLHRTNTVNSVSLHVSNSIIDIPLLHHRKFFFYYCYHDHMRWFRRDISPP